MLIPAVYFWRVRSPATWKSGLATPKKARRHHMQSESFTFNLCHAHLTTPHTSSLAHCSWTLFLPSYYFLHPKLENQQDQALQRSFKTSIRDKESIQLFRKMQFSASFLLLLGASNFVMSSPQLKPLALHEKRQVSIAPNPDALPGVNTHAGECKSEGSAVSFEGVSVTPASDITTNESCVS